MAQLTALGFSPDGQWLAGGSEDGAILLWRVKTCEMLLNFRAHEKKIRCLAFSPDSRRLASGSEDVSVRILDMGLKGFSFPFP